MSAFAACRSTVSKPFGKPVVDRLEKLALDAQQLGNSQRSSVRSQ
jgi:hypothetical protein